MCTQNIFNQFPPFSPIGWPKLGIHFEFWPNMQQVCPHPPTTQFASIFHYTFDFVCVHIKLLLNVSSNVRFPLTNVGLCIHKL